jgi:osmoprotectant transport system permease protein
VREYRAHAESFHSEFWRHVLLVAVSVSLALLIGLPLGAMAFGSPRFARRLFAVLSIIQTIPSIALFGLLIGPLTALGEVLPLLHGIGIAGIGTTPAVIALVLYGLLPLVRNTVAGLEGVAEPTIDAARGSGMRSAQILFKVRLPLALPVILSGLRVVLIQTIGLAVIAALIGAGGLGVFVFLGLGQNAIDLIMLGVIPTIVLALVTEVVFSMIIAATRTAP